MYEEKENPGKSLIVARPTRRGVTEKVIALLVYVNDIIVTRNDDKEQQQLKESLARAFEIKDLGKLKYFLGIEVAYSKEGIFLPQRKYILDLLKGTRMLGGKGASTLVEPNLKLSENPNC